MHIHFVHMFYRPFTKPQDNTYILVHTLMTLCQTLGPMLGGGVCVCVCALGQLNFL